MPPIRDRFESMVARLIKSPESLLASAIPFHMALIHSALGIAGELGELQEPLDKFSYDGGTPEHRLNFIEEAGDFLFYVIDLRRNFRFDTRPDLRAYTVEPCFSAVTTVGNVVDTVKRIVVYGKAYTREELQPTEDDLALLELWLDHELSRIGSSLDAAMRTVLLKLCEGPNARYPEGYNDAAANARRDKATGPATCE